jgi:hypothetical protein
MDISEVILFLLNIYVYVNFITLFIIIDIFSVQSLMSSLVGIGLFRKIKKVFY